MKYSCIQGGTASLFVENSVEYFEWHWSLQQSERHLHGYRNRNEFLSSRLAPNPQLHNSTRKLETKTLTTSYFFEPPGMGWICQLRWPDAGGRYFPIIPSVRILKRGPIDNTQLPSDLHEHLMSSTYSVLLSLTCNRQSS